MNVRDLAIKFSSYAHYIASREWARERSLLPRLLCVAPDTAQERRIQRVAQPYVTHSPRLVLRTTTVTQLADRGLLAAIWSQVVPSDDGPVATSRYHAATRTTFFAQADAGRIVTVL